MRYIKLFENYNKNIKDDVKDALVYLEDSGFIIKVTTKKFMSEDMKKDLGDLHRLYMNIDYYSKVLKNRLKEDYKENWIVDTISSLKNKHKYELELNVIIEKDGEIFEIDEDILESILTINSMVDELPEVLIFNKRVYPNVKSGSLSLLMNIDPKNGYTPSRIKTNTIVLSYYLQTDESWDLLHGFGEI